jgi:phosphatidylglycerol lysyltransferase
MRSLTFGYLLHHFHRILRFKINKSILQFILTALFLGLAIWFFHHEKVELTQIEDTLVHANLWWVLVGLLVTVIYIMLQARMYVASFASIGCRFPFQDSVLLFLKRNFISVFLPAGGISSLAFFSRDAEKEGISRTEVYLASAIYGYIGIVTVILIALPFLPVALFKHQKLINLIPALGIIIMLLTILYISYRSIIIGGRLYQWIQRWFPDTSTILDELLTRKINSRQIISTVIYSLLIEITGILHVYIAMIALGFQPSLFMAVMAYVISVVFLVISPFLRGLGAIEFSMSYVFIQSGFSNVEAVSVTLLYRLFEFWSPLLAGLISFIYPVNRLLLRILPPLGTFLMGIVNIASAVTPALSERLSHLQQFIPIGLINASNFFVLVLGFLLLALSAFLLKGLRTAWWLALLLTAGSLVGHIFKGIDVEEASVALILAIILILSRKEYRVRSDPRLRTIGIGTAIVSMAVVMIYGTIGFYFLDHDHFHIDFDMKEAVMYSIQNFFLLGNDKLVPHSAFAHHFLLSIQVCGMITLLFLFYTIIRPFLLKIQPTAEELEQAKSLVEQYGNSPLDYFKTYWDKSFFIPENIRAFLAYRINGRYAVVLENPIAENEEEMIKCLGLFERFCRENGLTSLYYRVPPESIPFYQELKKKSILIGEEATLDTFAFTLEGKEMKSVRNAINKITSMGFTCTEYQPPLMDGFIQKLRAVSDEWLRALDREELVFSQGVFDEIEIKQQMVLAVENKEEKVVAFVNIVPDYKKGEGTFDLMRKTSDSPNGVMDFMMISLLNYFRSRGLQYVNLGFAPFSGLEKASGLPEKTLKFAYENFKALSHYKGQREFKNKFKPAWEERYLVYNHDLDLMNIPAVLRKIIRP